MTIKHLIEKLFFGGDIHEDLVIAETELHDAHDKYDNACSIINTLKEECKSLEESLKSETQELSSLQSEMTSLDDILSRLLKDDEISNAKSILENKLDAKKEQLLNLKRDLISSEKEREQFLAQLGELQKEKSSLEKEVELLTHEVEELKEVSKQRDAQNTKMEKQLAQRKEIKNNFATLQDEWQNKLNLFQERLLEEDKLQLRKLQSELEDFERLIKNHIEIPVE